MWWVHRKDTAHKVAHEVLVVGSVVMGAVVESLFTPGVYRVYSCLPYSLKRGEFNCSFEGSVEGCKGAFEEVARAWLGEAGLVEKGVG